MKRAVARTMMIVADRCMGGSREAWSQAMLAEFEEAADAGEELGFAFGCLLAAWREMPAQEEGRLVVASHVLALGVLIPVAAMLLFAVAGGQPYLASDHASLPALAVDDGNRAGLPALLALAATLGVGHLYVAWAVLERRWARVAVAGRIAAATVVTGVLLTGILFLRVGDAMPQAVAIAVELAAVRMLVRWHGTVFDAEPGQRVN